MLEKMEDFFDGRFQGYAVHPLSCIAFAEEFYPFTAECLSQESGAKLLDLGCATGLELEYYFPINPTAELCGIELAPGMLAALKKRFLDIG